MQNISTSRTEPANKANNPTFHILRHMPSGQTFRVQGDISLRVEQPHRLDKESQALLDALQGTTGHAIAYNRQRSELYLLPFDTKDARIVLPYDPSVDGVLRKDGFDDAIVRTRFNGVPAELRVGLMEHQGTLYHGSNN